MQSKIGKYTVSYFNRKEFHSLKQEIFTNDLYYFESEQKEPLIVDVGAYIGLSILYFKTLYPNSKIEAFEPNPIAVEKLKENLFLNRITDVKIHNTAIWKDEGFKNLYIDNTDMNRFSVGSFNRNGWNQEVVSRELKVRTERLTKYLKDDIDLLKLDVEGSEQQILADIEPYFDKIKNIILEYHPTKNQKLEKVLKILNKKFYTEIYTDGKKIEKRIPQKRLLTIRAIYKH